MAVQDFKRCGCGRVVRAREACTVCLEAARRTAIAPAIAALLRQFEPVHVRVVGEWPKNIPGLFAWYEPGRGVWHRV